MSPMNIVAIDFEASCLPRHGRSFPIEVGIYDGSVPKSWLILPHGDWRGWNWEPEAEALHGIAYETLLTHGLPAPLVMKELAGAVAGRRLVADSGIDQYWLDMLASAAGYGEPPVIDHVALILDEWQVSADQVAASRAVADRLQPLRHRAGHDAHWLGLVLDDLYGQRSVPERIAVAA
ncbi:MAG: hypothetical protein QM690_13115 [Sphingobium sp.]